LNYEQAFNLVIEALKESIDDTTDEASKLAILEASDDTKLFGGGGILDSMGVVILLSDLEEKIEDNFETILSLASDSTMSRAHSPFRSVKSLAEYIINTVND
jgi:acyl carrier protein